MLTLLKKEKGCTLGLKGKININDTEIFATEHRRRENKESPKNSRYFAYVQELKRMITAEKR